jgi:signal transduction histidine kinase
MDAASALNLLRIVQEALANIVAHARAATISIIAHNAPRNGADGVRILVIDDGRGFQSSGDGGKGLGTMRTRAAALGAFFSVNPAKTRGVEVELWLPALRNNGEPKNRRSAA